MRVGGYRDHNIAQTHCAHTLIATALRNTRMIASKKEKFQ